MEIVARGQLLLCCLMALLSENSSVNFSAVLSHLMVELMADNITCEVGHIAESPHSSLSEEYVH